MGIAAAIRNLGARRRGSEYRCACPVGCGYALTLRSSEDGAPLWHCKGGCTQDQVGLALVPYGLFDADDAECFISPPSTNRPDSSQRIEAARRIYAEAGAGSLVATYLYEARGISLLPPDILKEHQQCPHRLGMRLRAMVAPVVDIHGEQVGIHMTYLRPDGLGKAEFGNPELQRETRGVIRGGAIRLMPHDPKRPLGIGEGIESSLSGAELFQLPAWSAVYAGGLKTVELPPGIHAIVIFADNDASGAGQRNALAAHDRWRAEGREVRIKCPPVTGQDFNDTLIARRG
jgi:hypothetical protein